MPTPINNFAQTVLDQMKELGPVKCSRLFGGYGFALDGVTFAIIIRDRLYLKVDDSNRARFKAKGLNQWVYESSKGKPVKMPYYLAPDEVLDERDAMAEWGGAALVAAHNTDTKKKK